MIDTNLNEAPSSETAAQPAAVEVPKPAKFHAVVYCNVGPNEPYACEVISTRSMRELKGLVKNKVEKGEYILAGVFRGTHIPSKVEMKQTVSFGE